MQLQHIRVLIQANLRINDGKRKRVANGKRFVNSINQMQNRRKANH